MIHRYPRTLLGVLVAGTLIPHALNAQPAADSEKFAVASIRPARPDANPPSIRFTPGGGIQATSVTLKLLIQIAYGVQPQQLFGGPGWTDSEQYDIIAKGPDDPGASSDAERQQIARVRLRALLADRFSLAVQQKSKEISGYALVVAKDGPKLTRSGVQDGRLRQMGMFEVNGEGALGTLARFIGARLGVDVEDKTGLVGRYDFTLRFAPESGRQPEQNSIPAAPQDTLESSISAALQELGLKLEPQKSPGNVVTIERAAKPTEN